LIIKSLDASGGGVFLNLLGAAKGALIRAAASTQPFGPHSDSHSCCERQSKRRGYMGLLSKIFRKGDSEQKEGPSSKTVMIRGNWMNAIWSDTPISVPSTFIVDEFFAQELIPPLLPDSQGYTDRYKDDNKSFAIHWIATLLHHPDKKVVRDVLVFWENNWSKYVDSEVGMPYRTLLFDSVADHLLSSDQQLAGTASSFIWRGYSESSFENLFSIFADPTFPDGPKAARRLALGCATEHLETYKRLSRQYLDLPL
jgi:hypothetical protein